MSGYFITLEGIDGAGTTTQAAKLATSLRNLGYEVHETYEPSGRYLGKLIREHLRTTSTMDPKTLALLFAADRLDHYQNEILPALKAGKIVLCDRYRYSSYVYQGLDCDDNAWIMSINKHAVEEDLCILLELDASEAVKRVAARKGTEERYDTLPFQEKLARRYRHISTTFRNCFSFDAIGEVDAIASQLLDFCLPLLPRLPESRLEDDGKPS